MKKPKDIKMIDERIEKFKKSEKKRIAKENSTDDVYARTATGWQISIELLAAVLIGAGIGYFLDNLLKTRPWLLVVFTLLGGAAGFLNLYRTFKYEEHKSKE